MTDAELAMRMGDGWVAGSRGVTKGFARVWYYPSSGRYGAEFSNTVAAMTAKADAETPELAVKKVLWTARNRARMTLEDIGAVDASVLEE